MKWTSDKPTEPGWYWYRWNHGTEKPVHISHARGDERLYRSDDQGYLTIVGGELAEWAGPLTPPEEP